MYWSSKQLITGKFIHVFINKPIPPKRHYTEERCYNKLCRNATETLWKERWSIFIHLSLNWWKSCRIGGMLTKVHFFRALRALNHVWSTICAVLCQERTHTMCVSLQKYLPLGLRVYIVGRDECTHFVSVCVWSPSLLRTENQPLLRDRLTARGRCWRKRFVKLRPVEAVYQHNTGRVQQTLAPNKRERRRPFCRLRDRGKGNSEIKATLSERRLETITDCGKCGNEVMPIK